MATCEDCKSTHPVDNVYAHYGWCKVVGGPGYHPRSWQGLQAELRQGLAEQAEREAEEAARRASNNGWLKYKGDERSYAHLASVTSEPLDTLTSDLDAVVRRQRMRDSSPVARHTEDGVLTRPGKELTKYWRTIAIKLVDEQGWTYRYKRKGGSHPRIIPPGGGMGVGLPTTVTDGHAGHRASYLTALKRAGAVIDAA